MRLLLIHVQIMGDGNIVIIKLLEERATVCIKRGGVDTGPIRDGFDRVSLWDNGCVVLSVFSK